jgi:hypothetical protein
LLSFLNFSEEAEDFKKFFLDIFISFIFPSNSIARIKVVI